MDTLYLLIPLSLGVVFAILALFGWALHGGQFDDLQYEGERILDADPHSVDVDQPRARPAPKESLGASTSDATRSVE